MQTQPSSALQAVDHRTTIEKAEALVTWRCAITTNGLIAIAAAVGPSSGILNLPGISRPFVISRLATIVVTVTLTAFLIAQRKEPRLSLARVLFALPAIPVLFMNWFLARDRAALGLPTELFVREAIATAVYALATPPRTIIGLAPIAAFTVESLLVYLMARWSHDSQVPSGQPWTGLLSATCMAALAVFRAHRQQKEVVIIVKLEQAAALRGLMRSYLAVRDLVNTPLQTLRISAHLLAARYPEAHEVTGSIERAAERLNELNKVLADEASAVEWSPGMEAFDPITILRARRSKPER
jgi:hypothetical protein